MRSESDGRRLGKRYRRQLDVEVHTKQGGALVRAQDVSRHGLFLAMSDPPKENHVVLLTVHLPEAPFETMAIVARRVVDAGRDSGAGVKLYCLASDAKTRWDRFIAGLSGQELSLEPRAATASRSASFLVQLQTPAEMEQFFQRHVREGQVVHVTPALKELGAEVVLVLVHPETQKELVLRATVAELYPDRPLRMGIRFLDVDAGLRREFRRFLDVGRSAQQASEADTLVAEPRGRFTEYAFYSPKLARPAAMQSAPHEAHEAPVEDLATIEGELLELEELDHVDKQALFDFNWWNNDD